MMDMSTQTDDLPPPPKKTPPMLPPRQNVARTPTPPLSENPETKIEEATPPAEKIEDKETDDSNAVDTAEDSKVFDEVDLEDDGLEEEPIIHEVHQAAAPQVITRARIIQVAKPTPPQRPVRNPFRNRISVASDISNEALPDTTTGSSLAVEKQSPVSTPSLRHGDSTSSLSSIEGATFERITNKLQPKPSNELEPALEKKEEKVDAFHSLPESPLKSVPGSFQ
jgi:hypothetical protein